MKSPSFARIKAHLLAMQTAIKNQGLNLKYSIGDCFEKLHAVAFGQEPG